MKNCKLTNVHSRNELIEKKEPSIFYLNFVSFMLLIYGVYQKFDDCKQKR